MAGVSKPHPIGEESSLPFTAPRACGTCSKAKVRCILGPTNAPPCLRCARLGKECNPQPARRRLAPAPRSRFDDLETRLNQLAHTIQKQGDDVSASPTSSYSTTGPVKPPFTTSASVTGQSDQLSSQSPAPAPAHHNGAGFGFEPAPYAAYLSHPNFDAGATAGLELWPEDGSIDILLSIYRNEMSSLFPFVSVPTKSTVDLRREHPCLFKAMITVASWQNRSLQNRRGEDLTRDLTFRLLIEGEKSLDLLQAMLVRWIWYHCYIAKGLQSTNLRQLVIALVADLGLNKPTHGNDRRTIAFDESRRDYGFTEEKGFMANDECRALLACFCVSTYSSALMARVECMKYTNHMENALQKLMHSRDQPNNSRIPNRVRLECLVEQISSVAPYDDPSRMSGSGVPIIMHLRNLQQKLDDIRAVIPEDDPFLLLREHYIRILLHEVSLYDTIWERDDGITVHSRLDFMWACLEDCRAVIDLILTLPPLFFLTAPYQLWASLAYALLISSRLTLSKVDGWDLSIVRSVFDFQAVLEHVKTKLSDANAWAVKSGLIHVPDEFLDKKVTKLEWMRRWHLEYTSQNDGTDQPSLMMDARGDPFVSSFDGTFWGQLMGEFTPNFGVT